MALYSGKELRQLCHTWYDTCQICSTRSLDADGIVRNKTLHLFLPGSLCNSAIQDAVAVCQRKTTVSEAERGSLAVDETKQIIFREAHEGKAGKL